MKIRVKKLVIKKDHRGWLSEILRPNDLRKKQFGQILITVALPGKTKGEHYHKRKTEWYCALKGKGLLTLIDNKSGKRKEVEMGEGNMVVVKIPPNTMHAVTNIGDTELYILVYVDEPFNKTHPDTYTL